MKNKYILFLFISLTLFTVNCAQNNNENISGGSMIIINIKIADKNFKANLVQNITSKALVEKMPLTINMSELNANEKYYYLSNKLPTSQTRIGNIKAGDIMLYGSDCLVLFYKSFNSSYSYTRLGAIENTDGLLEALGSGSVETVWTLAQ